MMNRSITGWQKQDHYCTMKRSCNSFQKQLLWSNSEELLSILILQFIMFWPVPMGASQKTILSACRSFREQNCIRHFDRNSEWDRIQKCTVCTYQFCRMFLCEWVDLDRWPPFYKRSVVNLKLLWPNIPKEETLRFKYPG